MMDPRRNMTQAVGHLYALHNVLAAANKLSKLFYRVEAATAEVETVKQWLVTEQERTKQCIACLRQVHLASADSISRDASMQILKIYNKWRASHELAVSYLVPLDHKYSAQFKTTGGLSGLASSADHAPSGVLFKFAPDGLQRSQKLVEGIALQNDNLEKFLQLLPDQLSRSEWVHEGLSELDQENRRHLRFLMRAGLETSAPARRQENVFRVGQPRSDLVARSNLKIKHVFDVAMAGLSALGRNHNDLQYVAGRLRLWSSGLFHAPVSVDDVFAFYTPRGGFHPLRAGMLEMLTEILVVVEHELVDMTAASGEAGEQWKPLRCEISHILENEEVLATALEGMARLYVTRHNAEKKVISTDDRVEIEKKKLAKSGSKSPTSGTRSKLSVRRPKVSGEVSAGDLREKQRLFELRVAAEMKARTFKYLSFCVESLFEILSETAREQRHYCCTQLERIRARKMSMETTASVRLNSETRPITLGRLSQKVAELVARHDRDLQNGGELGSKFRALRNVVESLPRGIVETRVDDLETAERDGFAHDESLYDYVRDSVQLLGRWLSMLRSRWVDCSAAGLTNLHRRDERCFAI
jgi:hypothetical protein